MEPDNDNPLKRHLETIRDQFENKKPQAPTPKRKARDRSLSDDAETVINLFVTCTKGLESILASELETLGYTASTGFCGVYVPFSLRAIYDINYFSRVATRVLRPIHIFKVYDQKSLYKRCKMIEWEKWIGDDHTFAIDANVRHPTLRHSLFAAQVMKDAICDRLRELRGFRPNIDRQSPDIQLNLFIDDDRCVVSFDTSRRPLHKRGYRKASVEAPLAETLAAALLIKSGFTPGMSFLDPCCGSGTIVIEAAMIAQGIPPGQLRRKWGFVHMPDYDEALFEEVKARSLPSAPSKIVGVDLDARAAWENVQVAGVDVELVQGAFQDQALGDFDLVVTNPPYGKRMEGDVSGLSELASHVFALWPGEDGWTFNHGGTPCQLHQLR